MSEQYLIALFKAICRHEQLLADRERLIKERNELRETFNKLLTDNSIKHIENQILEEERKHLAQALLSHVSSN